MGMGVVVAQSAARRRQDCAGRTPVRHVIGLNSPIYSSTSSQLLVKRDVVFLDNLCPGLAVFRQISLKFGRRTTDRNHSEIA